jgi:outer membrane protein OmpA-like peptidoglycan-associated protein
MSPRTLLSKKVFLSLAALIIFSLLFSFLALPRILQSQAVRFIAEKTGHHLSMQRPEFNPFKLSLRLSGLQLTQPDGKPLLSFNELIIDLSSASLFRSALIFDDIHLDGLHATGALLANGKLNWSPLIDTLQSKDKPADSPLPKFNIHHLNLSNTQLDLSDQRTATAFVSQIKPLDVQLNEFSSLPGIHGSYQLSAQTLTGIHLTWQGDASLTPLAATGNIKIDDIKLDQFANYFKDLLPFSPPAGIAALSTSYRLGFKEGKVGLNLEHISAKLSQLELAQIKGSGIKVDAVEADGGSFDLAKNQLDFASIKLSNGSFNLPQSRKALALGQLVLEDIHVNLADRQARLKRIALNDGQIQITRDAQGRIDILDALKTLTPTAKNKPKTGKSSAQANWHYQLDHFDLAGFGIAFKDEMISPAAQLALQDIVIGLTDISQDLNSAIPVKASFTVSSGGHFATEGNVVPGAPTADLQIKLTDLDLQPAQAYLTSVAKLKLVSGRLSSEGSARYSAKDSGFQGNVSLQDLLLNEADTGNIFLGCKSLSSSSFAATAEKLDIDELILNGLDTKLIINKDKSLSFKSILRKSATAAAAPANTFAINIDRLRLARGEMDFADYSLSMPFGTRIHDLKGIITGLSTKPDAVGQLLIDGQVDAFGIARASGKIDLMNPTDFTDIKVVFRNIEMSELTPYSATFAGRKIASGKLSLDLEYKIKQRQLVGKNQIIMNQLTLGEKVASAEAKDLPLDLAVSILQDADGVIDLGLPISGSLDDPKFSYGGIVWQAINNILSKIATAPFRALGALFGADDKFENIVFDAGTAELAPPEREKLLRLAEILGKRPSLAISVQGVYADSDRVALQDLQLRRTVAQMSGQHLAENEDPGPLSTHQARVQTSLETLFTDSLGDASLSSLKEGFRRANPGQLKESTAGKMMSGLKGLLSKKRTLSDGEVAQLKGVDFYTVLFERLRGGITIDDKQLQTLASSRGEAAAAALKQAGASGDRITVLGTEKVTTEGREVAIKLLLGSINKHASTAVTN